MVGDLAFPPRLPRYRILVLNSPFPTCDQQPQRNSNTAGRHWSAPDAYTPGMDTHTPRATNTHDRIRSRLEELKQVPDGWADGMQVASKWGDGCGTAPSHAGLAWLADQFDAHYPANASAPRIYPTPEGGVEVEWTIGRNEPSLEIDLADRTAEWHCTNLDTRAWTAGRLDLDNADHWRRMVDRIHQMQVACGTV